MVIRAEDDVDERSRNEEEGVEEQEQKKRVNSAAVMKLLQVTQEPPRTIPHTLQKKDALGHLVRRLLKVDRIDPAGRIACTLTVDPICTNGYNTLHGGAVGVISEMVALACVRSVAGDKKDFFLGEWAASYHSAARLKEEVQVEGIVIRQGRNVIATSVEFWIKQTRKLVYSARATYYSIPVAHL